MKTKIDHTIAYVESNDDAGRVFGGHLDAGAKETIVVIIRRYDAGA